MTGAGRHSLIQAHGHRWSKLLLAVFYLLVSVAAAGANPFKGETITPFDILIGQRAWSYVDPGVSIRQGERSDILDSRLPKWMDARNQARSGQLPLWNPDRGGGEEALFNLGYSIFTPAWLIFAITPSQPLGFYLATLLNLLIAGLGMHLFLRRRVGVLAAVVGAISFQLCGFHAAWLYWPHVLTAIWTPWLLFATEECISRPSMKSCLWLSVISAMVVLGGFPFVGMMVFGAAALYAIYLVLAELRKGNRVFPLVAWYAVGTTFGFVLSGLSLIGFAYWLSSYDVSYRHGGSILHLRDWKLIFAPWSYEVGKVEKTLYVGTILAVAAFLAPIYFCLSKKFSPFFLFSTSLMIISGSLVFGFFPEKIASYLPGLSSNIWTRAICIFDLALILLGVLLLDSLQQVARARRWMWLSSAIVVLAIIQIFDVGNFFRKYNGPVPATYYYPTVPAINYMKSRLGPFDYVIADKSFLISGTLDAYGIKEWFAHKFRSKPLQDALMQMADNASSSPTSSRLQANDIKLFSPAMATFNVRFLAINSDINPYAVRPASAVDNAHSPLPVMPAHKYRQVFRLTEASELSAISVRLATYGKSGLGGHLVLSLQDEAGNSLVSTVINADLVRDNAIVDFRFSAPLALDSGAYAFTLSYKPEGEVRPITAWSFLEKHGDGVVYVDSRNSGRVMDYFLHLKTKSAPFERVFTQAGVSVYVNTHSPGGPYFIQKLEEIPNSASDHLVSVKSYKPSRFIIDYVGKSPGYVVVPMNMRDDWKAYSNGKELVVERKQGLMPAVPVKGPSRIVFEYHPRVFRWIGWWLLSIVTLLGLMSWMHRRRFSGALEVARDS